MKKITMLLISTAVFTMSASVLADDKETYDSQTKIERDASGNYTEKDKIVSTNAEGKATAEKKVNISDDNNGNANKTVETENTKKTGWFSKDSVKTKDTEKTKSDGSLETSHKKVVNGTTTESNKMTITPTQ